MSEYDEAKSVLIEAVIDSTMIHLDGFLALNDALDRTELLKALAARVETELGDAGNE